MLLRKQMAGECRRYSINGEKSPKFILCDVLKYCFKKLLKITDADGNFVALVAYCCLSPFFQVLVLNHGHGYPENINL